jgi:ABC-type sugar transport system substrate-binding protein
MQKLRIVVSLPNDNAYQHEQGVVATATGKRLGIDLEVIRARDDSITQSQQLLEIIQSRPEARPDAFLVEPVTAPGLSRVAEAAGIAWAISNSGVDYVQRLRKNPKIPAFTVTQGQYEIGRLQCSLPQCCLGAARSCSLRGQAQVSLRSSGTQGMDTAKPGNVQLTTLRSKWNGGSAYQRVAAWLKLATSRAEKFNLVVGQTHELALVRSRKSSPKFRRSGTIEKVDGTALPRYRRR